MTRRLLVTALTLGALAVPTGAMADEPAPPVTMPVVGKQSKGAHRGEPRRRGPRAAEESEVARAPHGAAPDRFPLAGYHAGKFYLRDDEDVFRFYPGMLLQIDTRAAMGRGVDELGAAAGEAVHDRMFVRRAQPTFAGQVLGRWSWLVTTELGRGTARLDHTFVDVELARFLSLQVGQLFVPLTMENRTAAASITWMERPLVTKLANQSFLDSGVMAYGSLRRGLVSYQAGVFAGDGLNRPNVDNRVDYVARVVTKPLAWTDSIAKDIQIGASGLFGMRRPTMVSYDMTPLETDGGYKFWDTQYFDGAGRRLHIIPSGRQTALAGEVRVPVSRLDFRFEFVAVRKDMREALDGVQATSTERFGHLSGSAFYAQVSYFLLGSPAITGKPGESRPTKLHFPRGPSHLRDRALELIVRGESLRATYSPGDRASVDVVPYPDQDIKVDVLGVGVNYYASRHAKVSLNYGYNMFPGSYRWGNDALAPGNLGCARWRTEKVPATQCHDGAHSLHEVGLRAQIAF